MLEKKEVVFVLGATNNLDFATANVIIGLKKHIKKINYDIIVFEQGFSELAKESINKIYPTKFIKYKFPYELNSQNEMIKHYTTMSFSIYECFNLLKEYKKVVWLDCDLLIQKDFSDEILRTESVSIVKEGAPIIENLKQPIEDFNLNLPMQNSGVVIFSDKIPSYEKLADECYQMTLKYADKLVCPDQTILTFLFDKFNIKVANMSHLYNCMPYDEKRNIAYIIHTNCANKFWNGYYFKEWERNNKEWEKLIGTKIPIKKDNLLTRKIRTIFRTQTNCFRQPRKFIKEIISTKTTLYKNSTTIPIALISDDNYSLATSVAIESVIKNKNANSKYKIYVLGIDISDKNKQLLESQSRNNAEVKVLELENKYKDINYSHPYISKALFFKFDIANVFSQYEKILYLDGDVIVNGDLTDFFETDLENNYAGVVKDLICYYEKHQPYNLKTESYFNAGVMLLNAKKIREENLYPKFIEELTTHNYPNSDQDVFNVIFNKQIKFLSLKYDFINLYYLFNDFEEYRLKNRQENHYSSENIEIFSNNELKDFELSAKNPLIIHYAGDKPWNLKRGKKFDIWKKYFRKSPYKNEKLKWQKNKKMFELDLSSDRKKIRFFGVGFNIKGSSKLCK